MKGVAAVVLIVLGVEGIRNFKAAAEQQPLYWIPWLVMISAWIILCIGSAERINKS